MDGGSVAKEERDRDGNMACVGRSGIKGSRMCGSGTRGVTWQERDKEGTGRGGAWHGKRGTGRERGMAWQDREGTWHGGSRTGRQWDGGSMAMTWQDRERAWQWRGMTYCGGGSFLLGEKTSGGSGRP